MVKLIALDLDETLLDRDGHLTPGNRRALLAAQEAGAEIVVATGRAYDTIPAEIHDFPGLRYAIAGNGATIYEMKGDRPILRKTLPDQAVDAVLGQMAGLRIAYEIFVEGRAYAEAGYLKQLDEYMMDDFRMQYVLATRTPVPDILAFIRAHHRELDSIAVIPRDMETRKTAMERLKALEGVYVTTSNIRLIEVNHPGSTKASGLRYLANLLGIAQADTAAFGNGDNDAEMLAWAGTGVSVAEGTALCKASADYVTGSYYEDGVAEAMKALWGLGELGGRR